MLAALKLPDVEAVKRVTVGATLPDDDDPGKRPADFQKFEKYISSKGKVPPVPQPDWMQEVNDIENRKATLAKRNQFCERQRDQYWPGLERAGPDMIPIDRTTGKPPPWCPGTKPGMSTSTADV